MFRISADAELMADPDGVKSSAEIDPAVPKVMGEAAKHAADFVGKSVADLSSESTSGSKTVVQIEDVRQDISEMPGAPEQITVEGYFFPALLLCSGWWERTHGRSLANA